MGWGAGGSKDVARTHFSVACDDDAVLLVTPRALIDVFVYVIKKALAALPRCAALHNARDEAPVDAFLAKLLDLQKTPR